MSKRDENFEKKLLLTFWAEADEHIRNMSSWLLELEKNLTDQQYGGLVETIFREAHSLKGAARAVNATEIESACQLLESIFSALKNKRIALSAALFDELHRSLDNIGALLLSGKDPTATPQSPHSRNAIQAIENALKAILSQASLPRAESTKATVSATVEAAAEGKSDTTPTLGLAIGRDESTTELVRVSALGLNSLLLQIEELRAPTGALSEHLAGLRDLGALLAISAKEKITVRLELRALREAVERRRRFQGVNDAEKMSEKAIPQFSRLSAVLEQNSNTTDLINSNFAELLDLAENNNRALSSKMASLREEARKLSLAPFSLLLQGFPKLVRDLCREVGKNVDLRVSGSEVEADRKLLQEIKDPLVHLLRNCVDHGIEAPAERERQGKPAMGTINLSIAPKDGDKIEIAISDDGAGVNTAKIRAALARAGSRFNEQTKSLSDKDILSFIFQSGVSTSPIITNLSGRGLGLAIARQKVEKLGGILTVENRPAAGTTFRIVLPLTLATFRGVLVRSGELLFIVPTASVEHVTRVGREEIKTIENRETVRYGDQTLSLARFRDILELSGTAMDPAEKIPILILWAAGERIAFQVDEILSEQEVLAKPLGPQLARVRNLAGATILNTGKTVSILNVGDLVNSAVKSGGAPVTATSSAKTMRKSVLIAEDSITARTLLKNIVESAGYDVKTAVDGLDAYTTLKTGKFDLVVSDVEMPRMTGFDLTAKIRADKEMSETPIVLITALDSREDRERGIDVGANAYIVKSSFDHGDLLQTIERLI